MITILLRGLAFMAVNIPRVARATIESNEAIRGLQDRADTLSDAMREIWNPNILPFLMGTLITFIGISSLLAWAIRFKARDTHFLYMGCFILLFGLRIIAGNYLMRVSGMVSPMVLLWTESLISYYLTIFSILFVTCFTGWGWKRSLMWFLILQACYSAGATINDIRMETPYYSGVPLNNLFAIGGTLLVLANLFQSHIRMNHEIRAIGIGFGIFAVSIVLANLAEIHLIPEAFSQEQAAFFICLCILIYVAIHYSKVTETNLRNMTRDLETARNIQDAILPQSIPSCGEGRITARYIPMTKVGGDFFDFQQVDDDHVGILVADVSGHGIPAALIASMVKIAFISEFSNAGRPEALLSGMNHTLTGQLNNEYITAIYLFIDLKTGEISFSIAGHPPPILIHTGSPVPTTVSPGGIPLGIRKDVRFPSGKISIAHGDRLLIYTDGLTELADSHGEQFGTARLSKIMHEAAELTIEKAADRILRAAVEWAGKKKREGFDDDLTFILIHT